MTFSEDNLAGCARISLKVLITTNFQLGCFGTSLDEDSKLESIDKNKIIGETYPSSNQNERIWETDTSRNLTARMEEKNIENKQMSLHKHEGEMEIYGLSLSFLFLINQ